MRQRFETIYRDQLLRDRAFAILHRMATENTGWRAFFRRWYYSDEPLRNDAANLLNELRLHGEGFKIPRPLGTRILGEPSPQPDPEAR